MSEQPSRSSRRADVTRGRLVTAARELLRRSDFATVPVAQITELADVGLGSFYNHFSSKDELFDAAVHDVLHEQAERIDALVTPGDDPVMAAALSLHVLLHLTEGDPEVAEIVARNGLRLLDADSALTPQRRQIIQQGTAGRLFADADPELLLAVVAGILIGGLHTWSVEPERVTARWKEELVTRALVALGVDVRTADDRSTAARARAVTPVPSTEER